MNTRLRRKITDESSKRFQFHAIIMRFFDLGISALLGAFLLTSAASILFVIVYPNTSYGLIWPIWFYRIQQGTCVSYILNPLIALPALLMVIVCWAGMSLIRQTMKHGYADLRRRFRGQSFSCHCDPREQSLSQALSQGCCSRCGTVLMPEGRSGNFSKVYRKMIVGSNSFIIAACGWSLVLFCGFCSSHNFLSSIRNQDMVLLVLFRCLIHPFFWVPLTVSLCYLRMYKLINRGISQR